MTQAPLDPSKPQSILKNIRKDMAVLDSAGDRIGKVEDIYFGADSDEMMEYGTGAVTAPDPSVRQENDIVTNVASAIFADDDMPEVLRSRLVNNGYIRINTSGIFTSDRYALPDQIARVHDDHVHLNVAKDELVKR